MSRLGSWVGDIVQIWAELPNLAKMLSKVYYFDFLRAPWRINIWRLVAVFHTIWQLWEKLKLLECYVIPFFPGFRGQWTRPWCYFIDLRSRSPLKVNLKGKFILNCFLILYLTVLEVFFPIVVKFYGKIINLQAFLIYKMVS